MNGYNGGFGGGGGGFNGGGGYGGGPPGYGGGGGGYGGGGYGGPGPYGGGGGGGGYPGGFGDHRQNFPRAPPHPNARPRAPGPPGRQGQGDSKEHTLFVYNAGLSTQEKDLYELFSPFGAVSRIDIVRDPNNNNSTKFAFVVMPDHEEATNAVQQLNGYNYTKRPLQVSMKK